jgi:hypothetical protein
MPIVKTQDGKVVTKDGKVSCECCEANCSQPILTSNFREFELTALEYNALYAGGVLRRDFASSGSLTYVGSTCSISATGTLNETTDYTVGGCSLSSSGTEISSIRNVTPSTTCGTAFYDSNISSSLLIEMQIFNNGNDYKYGAQIRFSSGQNNLSVIYRLGAGLFSAIIFQNSSTTASTDNATRNITILGRTIAVPYALGSLQGSSNRSGSFSTQSLSVTQDAITFAPSAP